jgi:rhodanese-related sulfurtransferase
MTMATASPFLDPGQTREVLTASPEARLLDVRMPGEYETAHIPGAYNVPLDTLAEHASEIRTLTAPIILVCQSGQRARRAEEALRQLGMTNLHVLDSGVTGWISAGYPVVRGPRRMSLERQVRILAGSLVAVGAVLALLVSPWFALLPALVGGGLVFSGVTDTCGLALLLGHLPHNRPASCDVPAMVRALTEGAPPLPVGRAPSGAAAACACGPGM